MHHYAKLQAKTATLIYYFFDSFPPIYNSVSSVIRGDEPGELTTVLTAQLLFPVIILGTGFSKTSGLTSPALF